MVGFVGWCEHFAFVDEVNAEGLQNLCFNKVTNTSLGHNRNRDGSLDTFDHVGVAHPSDSPIFANVGRNSFKSHDCTSASIFGNLGLPRGHHIHDDSTLEHFGKTPLNGE